MISVWRRLRTYVIRVTRRGGSPSWYVIVHPVHPSPRIVDKTGSSERLSEDCMEEAEQQQSSDSRAINL
jgi:hypothetical protein